jgi:PAS domain S-box-containing protein
MLKLSIAQRLAILAAGVALVMTIGICLLSFLKGRAVLTEHEVANLGDECTLRVFEIREEFRYITREVRDAAVSLPKPERDQPFAEFAREPAFDAAAQAAFQRMLAWADQHARHSPRSWIDRDSVIEAYFLRVDPEGDARLVKTLRREGPQAVEIDPAQEAPLAEAALTDIQTQLTIVAGKQKSGPARQFMSQVRPDRTHPSRRTICVGYEFAGRQGTPWGLYVLALDFTRMIANQERHSPRHLFFVVDRDGNYLVHPDETKVGNSIRADLDAEHKPRFNFQSVPWAGEVNAGETEPTGGESQLNGTLGSDLRYEFTRKAYGKDFPFRDEARREALTKDLDELAQRDRRFRFTHPRPGARNFGLAAGDANTLKEAERLIELHEQAAGYKGGADWEGPVECTSFAAHVAPFRLGIDRPGTEEVGEPIFLILAASLEEIALDIRQATRWVWWISLLMCVAAAALALLPATWLTGPLRRITGAAQRLADGDYQADLPEKSAGEIGDLARAFRHMTGQIHQRDQALRDAVARLQAVLRTAADGIITFNERGVIEEWNQAAERIFGYTAQEILGQKVQRLMELPPELARPAGDNVVGGTVRALSKVVSAPSTIRQGRRKDGTLFWMEVAFSEVPVGERRLTTGIFRDVTQRIQDEERIKRMNEELEARVQLRTAELQDAKGKLEVALHAAQEASQAKDVFVRTISHELRTPLSAVKGFTELLLNPKATKLRENPIPTLQKIHSASDYLLTLINDLLDVARYTAGEQIHLSVSEFDLKRFFDGIVEMANPLLKKNANRLNAQPGDNLGRMRADETRVRQILLNLLSNAAKFTENGEITFGAAHERPDGSDEILFTVADTGTGMTHEQMQNLFKPFYRVDNSITRKHGGTGLGLSISKLLSERMGGSISVQSEPGKGTRFTVRLPAVVAAAEAPVAAEPGTATPSHPPPAPDSAPLRKDLVLVIDDDADTRDMLQSFLLREGFRVSLAASGDEGLRLARDLRPGAITLDVLMPDTDGWAVLTVLKNDPRTRDIPVVMLSVTEDHTRGYALGASDFVTKPIDWNRLGEILHKYSAAPASILVVEDDQLQRETISQTLSLADWTVRQAGDGREALRLLEAETPAVILLDLIMPGMDGFQFLDELRRRPGWERIPVVVVTAKELTDDDRRRLSGGVAQVLQKGAVSREALLAQILAAVCNHVPCSAAAPKERVHG